MLWKEANAADTATWCPVSVAAQATGNARWQQWLQVSVALQIEAVSSVGMTEARSMTISQVLGTDMKKHFDITSRFQVHSHLEMLCCANLPQFPTLESFCSLQTHMP